MKKPALTLFTCSVLLVLIYTLSGCGSAKKIPQQIARRVDTTAVVVTDQAAIDSMFEIKRLTDTIQQRRINFNTFSAKVKVEYEDAKGKQPNITAHIRMIKDSLIWVSGIATVFNIEAFRALITKDSVIILDKINKLVERRSIDYLQEVTQIPFNLNTLQDLIIGNPVFFTDSVLSYKKNETQLLISTVGESFKHLLTLNRSDTQITHSKLDDVNMSRNRTADITYSEYELMDNRNFSTNREITVSEKNKLDIQMKYKQYEFDKEVQISFNIPKNYKKSQPQH